MKHKKAYPWFTTLFFLGACVIATLPLLNIPPLFAPPDWGKAIVFRTLMGVILFLWLFMLIKGNQEVRNALTPSVSFMRHRLLISFLVLFLLFAVSIVFSADPWLSFWGTPSRAGGFLNLALFFSLALLAGWILNKAQWKTLWLVSLISAALVAVLAIFQHLHLFSFFLVPSVSRPTSTLGGPIFLAVYLMLNAGIAGMFAAQESKKSAKVVFVALATLFISVGVLLASSRAAMVGMGAGGLWLLFAYPTQRIMPKLMGGAVVLLSISVIGYFFFFPQSIPQKPDIARIAIARIVSIPKGDPSRTSSWTISWEAMKKRPLVGYGLENFHVGFDLYYDPSLPGIAKDPEQSSSWWDRAHNMLFDTGVQAGIPTLLALLVFFSLLLIELQYKKSESESRARKMEAHIVQATLIAYLVSNLFSFDTFSVFMMTFLLFGYVFSLRAKQPEAYTKQLGPETRQPLALFLRKFSLPVLAGTGVLLVVFVWKGALEPLLVNSNVNLALALSKQQYCAEALAFMDRALTTNNSTIQPYARLRFIDVTSNCQTKISGAIETFIEKNYRLMQKNTREMPQYVRNWIFLGKFANNKAEYILKGRIGGDGNEIQRLFEESQAAFEKAHEMSPKRQEVYVEWVKTFLSQKKFKEANEKAQECVALNAQFGECWWMKGITEIYLGNQGKFERDRIRASERGYNVYSMVSFSQLIQAYRQKQDLSRLADVFEKMVETAPRNADYRVALAMAYKDIGQFGKARKEALKVLELNPALQKDVDAFLLSLP